MEHAQEIVATTQLCMREASKIILNGFELDSDVKVVTSPERYMDEDRGVYFWNIVMKQIGRSGCLYHPPSVG